MGLGLCWGPGLEELAYLPIAHQPPAGDDLLTPAEGALRQLPLDQVLTALAPWLASAEHPKTLQNAKYDRLVLLRHGLPLAGVVMDTLLADYLRDANAKHGLEVLAERNFGFTPPSFSDLVPKGATFAAVPLQPAALYCGMDVHVTWRLTPLLRDQLAELGPALPALLEQVELPLEPVLALMEATGIRIDTPYLAELSAELAATLDDLESRAREAAGVDFNLASPKQLGELLFDTLGLDRRKSRRTKTGWSTDAAVLEKLEDDHPGVAAGAGAPHPQQAQEHLRGCASRPGGAGNRQGSHGFQPSGHRHRPPQQQHPNLQNIPVRTEFSRRIRKAFLPRRAGS